MRCSEVYSLSKKNQCPIPSLSYHVRFVLFIRAAVRLQEEQTAILEQQKEEARRKSEQNRSVEGSTHFRFRLLLDSSYVYQPSFSMFENFPHKSVLGRQKGIVTISHVICLILSIDAFNNKGYNQQGIVYVH